MTKCGGRSFAEEGLGGMPGEVVEGSPSIQEGEDENCIRMKIGDIDDGIKVCLIAYITFNVYIKNSRIKLQLPSLFQDFNPAPDKIKTVGY
jgi:hypothetical protein